MSQKAILAGVRFQDSEKDGFEYSLAELHELAQTAGFTIISTVVQSRNDPDVSFYIGKGKLEEISSDFSGKADVIIFNHDLSPSQIRNVEKASGFRALTRTEVILDIFAIHAKTRASKLQVEMAKLSYLMPRIIGKGIEMSRIEGGIGMKGPGEQQLELDRRKIRYRISLIKKELEHLSRERENQRKKRRDSSRKISIVGYTNSGKSTLLNRLTKEKVPAENKLFVTLDTTTRKLWLYGKENALITDTVGFIRDIPHGLIESFKSTFEDALQSDLLIHVVDLSAPDYEIKKRVAEETLGGMSARNIPLILAFNKTDLVDGGLLARMKILFPDALFISAASGMGLDLLRQKIIEHLGPEQQPISS